MKLLWSTAIQLAANEVEHTLQGGIGTVVAVQGSGECTQLPKKTPDEKIASTRVIAYDMHRLQQATAVALAAQIS